MGTSLSGCFVSATANTRSVSFQLPSIVELGQVGDPSHGQEYFTARVSYPIYFYGQHYQGSLDAYLYSLIHVLIAPLALSVLVGNAFLFSLFLLFGSLLINQITDSSSFFYSLVVLSVPFGGLLFFSMYQVHGFALVACLQIILIYFVFQSSFGKREHPYSMGVLASVLVWSYQPSLPIMAVGFTWLLARLVTERRWKILGRTLYRMLAGFLLGAFPHILSEINNGLINTMGLLAHPGVMDRPDSVGTSSLGRILAVTVMSSDSTRLAFLEDKSPHDPTRPSGEA